ncbi:MAG: FtsH protease activity modulator HflK [Spirochaetaceae bacterium]|nr:FtsH protease activity modulator HflK [Spirochaetaceae bacterium]
MKNVTPSRVAAVLRPATVLLVIAAVAVIVLLGTSVYIVDQTEEAVVTRFGRYHTTAGPGLQFKLPFGIDRHYVVNVKNVQTEQFGFRTLQSGISSTYASETRESTMLTGDLNIIDVEWIIQYRVVDPVAWTFNVMEREKTIRDVSRSAINMLVGDRTIMDIMGPERSAIEIEGMNIMNETFRSFGLGISVIAVKLQNIDPPPGVQEAFDDVNKAEQDMNRLINEGLQAYNAEIPKAKGESERLIQVAQGYATERLNRTQGDVARFDSVYEEYRKAPEITRRRLYYEMVEEVFKDDRETVIIDRNFDNFLPLRNLGTARGGN